MTKFSRHKCFDGVYASPEFAARRLLMSALLYYEFSCNVMSDHEYDALGEFVRDNWEHVPEHLRFLIGEEWAEDDGLSGWTASGANFKYSRRVFYGALSWARHLDLYVVNEREWQMVDFDMGTGIEYDVSRG